jgi:hypothetical protein
MSNSVTKLVRNSVHSSLPGSVRGPARKILRRDSRCDHNTLEDLPNVGRATATDLRGLGIRVPGDLKGRDPYALYDALNRATGTRHDPCVLDTFISAVRYVEGAPARPWWKYTAQRKRTLAVLAKAKEKTHG